MKKKEKKWFAYHYRAKIALIEHYARPDFLGAFFNSWDLAHDYLISEAEREVRLAETQLRGKLRHRVTVLRMKKPPQPGE